MYDLDVRGAALLVVVFLAVVVVANRTQADSGSRGDGRITVIVGESGDAGPSPRLVVVDADGKNARLRLGWVWDASFSPDGRSIAYTLRVQPYEIWVLATDGRGGGRRLVRNGLAVEWSPSGDVIAFERDTWKHSRLLRSDIWIENLRSRMLRRVVRDGMRADWSPDGKKLAFVRGSDIWVVDVVSKMARRLIRHADSPRWSPDGDRIAFLRYRGPQAGSVIYVARADGTAERRVVEADFPPAWSPDGSKLAVCGFKEVSRIRLDGTHARVVYRGRPACQGLDWVR